MEKFNKHLIKIFISSLLLLTVLTANAFIPPQTVVCKPNASKRIICNFDEHIKSFFYMSGTPEAGTYNFNSGYYFTIYLLSYDWKSPDGKQIAMQSVYGMTNIVPDYNGSAWPRNTAVQECQGLARDCPYTQQPVAPP